MDHSLLSNNYLVLHKHVPPQKVSIYYTCKNIRQQYKNNKIEITDSK